MSDFSNIEIKTNNNKGYTEIFVDGHKLNGVRSFNLAQDGYGLPTLTVDLNAVNISVDCVAITRHKGYEDMRLVVEDSDGNKRDLT